MPLLGACAAGAELVLVVDGADQFPNWDFTAGWAAGCVVVMEPVEEAVLVMLGNTDGATVVLLVNPPNIEAALLEDTADAGLVLV